MGPQAKRCRRAAWRHAFGVLALAFLLQACATPPPEARQGGIQHIVLFWLKDPGNAEHRRRIVAATRELATIPGLLAVSAGPVIASNRPIVDDSFDVGVVMRFDSEAAMRAYLVHPRHKKAVAEVIRPLVKKIQVYDFRID